MYSRWESDDGCRHERNSRMADEAPARSAIEDWRARLHRDFVEGTFNSWGDITKAEISEFRRILAVADHERPLQKYLERNPDFLGSSNGRRVIPQKRLGPEFAPDFL